MCGPRQGRWGEDGGLEGWDGPHGGGGRGEEGGDVLCPRGWVVALVGLLGAFVVGVLRCFAFVFMLRDAFVVGVLRCFEFVVALLVAFFVGVLRCFELVFMFRDAFFPVLICPEGAAFGMFCLCFEFVVALLVSFSALFSFCFAFVVALLIFFIRCFASW